MAESRNYRRYNFRAHDKARHEKDSKGSAPWKLYTLPGMKQYKLGCDVDKETIFDFPFLADEDSVSYLKEHKRIMFIVRGPPGSGKATLSEMLAERYPSAAYCCADRYFTETFTSNRNTETLKKSHEYCEKLAITACSTNKSPVIIQNTHVKKWEMQKYLNLAAQHNYTVIMAITMFKFEVTPKALEKTNSDGLNLDYFEGRLRKWEHVLPYVTGWFLCPEDTSYILNSTKDSLKKLLSDGKFCRIFNIYDDDDMFLYYKAMRLLCCVAGYTKNKVNMEKYYFSSLVQNYCGKSCSITILGYIVSQSTVTAIAHVEDMECLLLKEDSTQINKRFDLEESFNALELDSNILKYRATIPLNKEFSTNGITTALENWKCDEVINVTKSTFIHMAQKDEITTDIEEIRKNFYNSLSAVMNNEGNISNDKYLELGEDTGHHLCRLPNNEWLIKIPQKITVKTVFTGFYN